MFSIADNRINRKKKKKIVFRYIPQTYPLLLSASQHWTAHRNRVAPGPGPLSVDFELPLGTDRYYYFYYFFYYITSLLCYTSRRTHNRCPFPYYRLAFVQRHYYTQKRRCEHDEINERYDISIWFFLVVKRNRKPIAGDGRRKFRASRRVARHELSCGYTREPGAYERYLPTNFQKKIKLYSLGCCFYFARTHVVVSRIIRRFCSLPRVHNYTFSI